jgi:hypothetical protein
MPIIPRALYLCGFFPHHSRKAVPDSEPTFALDGARLCGRKVQISLMCMQKGRRRGGIFIEKAAPPNRENKFTAAARRRNAAFTIKSEETPECP